MKHLTLPASCLLLTALLVCPGCKKADSTTATFDQRNTMNRWAVQDYFDQQRDQAILTQHTLYPYHFQANASELNELGMRDLLVLASHYREAPGRLNLQQGDASDALYEARVAHVKDSLAQAGVDAQRVTIADDLPGGSGVPADRVLVILGADVAVPSYPEGKVPEQRQGFTTRTTGGSR